MRNDVEAVEECHRWHVVLTYLSFGYADVVANAPRIGAVNPERCQARKWCQKTYARLIGDANASRIARIAVGIRPLVLTPGESMALI